MTSGWFEILKGNLEKAKETLESAKSMDDSNFLCLKRLGIVYKKLKEFLKSAKILTEAAKFNSYDSEIFKNLGSVLQKIGRNSQAIKCFQQSLQLRFDPKLAKKFCDFLIGIEKFDDAILVLKNFIQKFQSSGPDSGSGPGSGPGSRPGPEPDSGSGSGPGSGSGSGPEPRSEISWALMQLGLTNLRVGNFEEAISAFQKFIRIHEKNLEALQCLAESYCKKSKKAPKFQKILSVLSEFIKFLKKKIKSFKKFCIRIYEKFKKKIRNL